MVCNDYKKRGGFKFEGEAIVYNCFNCAHDAKFITNEHTSIPDKMQTVFDAFGIPKEDFQEVIFKVFASKKSNSAKNKKEAEKNPLVYNDLKLPSYLRPLITDGTGDVYDQLACEYLEVERGIDPASYPFHIADRHECTKVDKESRIRKAIWPQWKGRIVIPLYRNKKVVFYQGRDIMDTDRLKYMSPEVSRDTVLYGYEELTSSYEKPLYIHEGFFDAFLLKDSVAVLTNKMTEQQIEILNRCPRQKVVIPDRQGNGRILADDAVRLGWSVSFPDIGSDAKDMNDAIKKYGRLYVLKSVVDNTLSGFAAESAIGIYCKK